MKNFRQEITAKRRRVYVRIREEEVAELCNGRVKCDNVWVLLSHLLRRVCSLPQDRRFDWRSPLRARLRRALQRDGLNQRAGGRDLFP
jgi:hypothetical protein